jgi:arginyl-tRNA synthetase
MIKERVKKILDNCFIEGVKQELWAGGAAGSYTVELPKHASHGDFSTNMAMVISPPTWP